MNPAQTYIDGIVSMLVAGRTVNWFADVNGAGYLIGTGPLNHSGQGNSSVLNRTIAGLAPTGPAGAAGDMTGNTYYSGTECQHPGDSTPWPQPMVDVMVAISAAEAMQWGWSAGAVIDHYEWTNRKIDMSLYGGPSSGSTAGNRMRAAVTARMTGATPAPTPTKEWDEMATKDEIKQAVRDVLGESAPSQMVNDSVINVLRGDEFKGEIVALVIAAINSGEFAQKINDLVINVLRSDEARGITDLAADGKIDNPPKG
jgi:hypothetical protein